LLNQGYRDVADCDLSGYLDPCSYYTLTDEGCSNNCGW
jgi:hypothetical protein